MAHLPAAILSVMILTVPIAVAAGRTLLLATPAPPWASLEPTPPAPAAIVVLLQPPPAAIIFVYPPVHPVPAASAILHHPPPPDGSSSYHIHVTRSGLLCVVVSFLAGCVLCALYIVVAARSRRRATSTRAQAAPAVNQDDDGQADDPMENVATQCLCCFFKVAGCL